MWVFWRGGYNATSMDRLVKKTGVARKGIYSDFGGKAKLYEECIKYYRESVAAPAVALLYSDDAGLGAIQAYFEYFIDLHRKNGMPGPGCMVANSMTEEAPHNTDIQAQVDAHNDVLSKAFSHSLRVAGQQAEAALSDEEIDELALFLVTSSQGLWSYARSIGELEVLENFTASLMALLTSRLNR